LKKDIRRKLLAEEIDAVIVQAHHLQVPAPESWVWSAIASTPGRETPRP